MLELDRLSASYGVIEALSEVSLAVGDGEIVAVVGSNGAGKSTLLRSIAGFHAPDSGTIHFDGEPIERSDVRRARGLGISLVPEGRQMWPGLSVEEHLRLGHYMERRDRGGYAAQLDEVFGLFPRLAERRTQRAGSLSGGEQQMVAIARALMVRPRLLLLDEPTLGLAPIVLDRIVEVLERLRSTGMTMLLVEQNARFAFSLAARAYVLEVGQVRAHGTPDELRASSSLLDAYLGTAIDVYGGSGE